MNLLAFWPHVPGHGSLHFWFKQAYCNAHSALTTHSGRQLGGEPIIFDWQAQTAAPFATRQTEFAPHGDGLHGFSAGTSCVGVGRQAMNASPE